MKNKELIKTCEEVFNLFDKDGDLTNKLATITNEPYFDAVSGFFGKKHKDLEDNCLECWNRLASVAFTYGFVMALMLNPNLKVPFKGIREIGATIRKAGLLPLK